MSVCGRCGHDMTLLLLSTHSPDIVARRHHVGLQVHEFPDALLHFASITDVRMSAGKVYSYPSSSMQRFRTEFTGTCCRVSVGEMGMGKQRTWTFNFL